MVGGGIKQHEWRKEKGKKTNVAPKEAHCVFIGLGQGSNAKVKAENIQLVATGFDSFSQGCTQHTHTQR